MNTANGKSTADLQLAFDVGHSSIGWAVLDTRIDQAPALLGCGAVIFPADDCLASARRDYRRQRRHSRATRQRIERMENFLAALKLPGLEAIHSQHLQGKGNERGKGAGFSYPWLHAARILEAKPDERRNHLLTWSQLWDVLRWYAHNRGYDGNLRWSGDYDIHEVSAEPRMRPQDVKEEADAVAKQEKKKADAGAENADMDSDKLKKAAELMELYGFSTQTFAGSVAKFLLAPEHKVTPGAPGKTGKWNPVVPHFPREEFERLLFGLEEKFREHPRHLQNYFKGLRCAFVRRRVELLPDGRRCLVGGTEWEVRTILRAHFNAPSGKARCDERFEQMICGDLPEKRDDWRAYASSHPHLYLAPKDRITLRAELGVHSLVKSESAQDRRRKRAAKREASERIRRGKIDLPARYQGGLLFGQIVPSFDNRIISECPITFSRKLEKFSRYLAGQLNGDIGHDEDLKQLQARLDRAQVRFAQTGKPKDEPAKVAEEYAADLAKVPSRHSLEFLDYRWARLMANLKVRRPDEVLSRSEGEKLRPLTPQERALVDAEARALGVLQYERAVTEKVLNDDGTESEREKKPEVNDLAKIVCKVLGYPVETAAQLKAAMEAVKKHTNLDGFFIPKDMKEALKFVPLAYADKAGTRDPFRCVWGSLSPWLQRRFAAQLLRCKKGKSHSKDFSAATVIAELQARAETENKRPDQDGEKTDAEKRAECRKAIDDIEAALAKTASDNKRGKVNAKKLQKLREEKFHCVKLKGRAAYHRDILRQVWREVMSGEDPTKPKRVDAMPKDKQEKAEKKAADGCLVVSETVRHFVDARPLARQTNNPLVRHRLLILDKLFDHLKEEFAQDAGISRVTIEATRDLTDMSGLSNKQKQQREDAKLKEHSDIADELADRLKDERIDGEPIKITPRLIKKARVAADLRWSDPYTSQQHCRNPICAYELARGDYELDHIIPRSQRLSNAMEAMVVTKRRINAIKGQRTALQFILDMNRPENAALKADLGIVTPDHFRNWVGSLPEDGASPADVRRMQKRKELLLVQQWNEDEFTPADLTNTSHVIKLAAQQLRAHFRNWPEATPPQVVFIPGSVTHAFRDRGWKAINALAEVHPGVQEELRLGKDRVKLVWAVKVKKGEKTPKQAFRDALPEDARADLDDFLKRLNKAVDKTAQEEGEKELDALLAKVGEDQRGVIRAWLRWRKSSLNPKDTIRGITHAHHALDAAVLALISHWMVPPGSAQLEGKLAKWIVQGALTEAEREQFNRTYHSLGLRDYGTRFEMKPGWALSFNGKEQDERARARDQFFTECNEELRELLDREAIYPFTPEEKLRFEQLVTKLRLPRPFSFDSRSRLHIRELDKSVRDQLKVRLKEAIERRIIQHVPADRSGLGAAETVYRAITDPAELDAVLARFHRVRGDGKGKLPEHKEGHAVLIVRKRRGGNPDEKKPKQRVVETKAHWFTWVQKPVARLFGLPGKNSEGSAKLRKQKAAKDLAQNFAIARLDHVTDPENIATLEAEGAEGVPTDQGKKSYVILIRRHRVQSRLKELRALNGGEKSVLFRSGMLIDVPRGSNAGRWRITSVMDGESGIGVSFTIAKPDGPERIDGNGRPVTKLITNGLQLIRTPLSGIAPKPTED